MNAVWFFVASQPTTAQYRMRRAVTLFARLRTPARLRSVRLRIPIGLRSSPSPTAVGPQTSYSGGSAPRRRGRKQRPPMLSYPPLPLREPRAARGREFRETCTGTRRSRGQRRAPLAHGSRAVICRKRKTPGRRLASRRGRQFPGRSADSRTSLAGRRTGPDIAFRSWRTPLISSHVSRLSPLSH